MSVAIRSSTNSRVVIRSVVLTELRALVRSRYTLWWLLALPAIVSATNYVWSWMPALTGFQKGDGRPLTVACSFLTIIVAGQCFRRGFECRAARAGATQRSPLIVSASRYLPVFVLGASRSLTLFWLGGLGQGTTTTGRGSGAALLVVLAFAACTLADIAIGILLASRLTGRPFVGTAIAVGVFSVVVNLAEIGASADGRIVSLFRAAMPQHWTIRCLDVLVSGSPTGEAVQPFGVLVATGCALTFVAARASKRLKPPGLVIGESRSELSNTNGQYG